MDNREIALAADMASSEGGGGGGTTDYTDLSNKPEINGSQLIGNKTAADLGVQPTIDTTHKLDADLVDDSTSGHKFAWSGTQAAYAQAATNIAEGELVAFTDDIDIDLVPTNGSLNPVTSNGVFQELKKLKVINENPENHNGIYRGKNLTNVYTIEQIYERVHDGSFEDLYLGDYFTVHLVTDLYTRFTGSAFESDVTYYEMDSGTDVTQRTWTVTQDAEPQEGKVYATKQVVEEDVDLMICGFDLYLNRGVGAALVAVHHIVLIPRNAGFVTRAKMMCDSSFDRTIGYDGSDMHMITLPCYAKSLKAALNGHIISYTTQLNGTVNVSTPSMAGAGLAGATTLSATAELELKLLNEIQCFGTMIASSSWREAGLDYAKFPVFEFITPVHMAGGYDQFKWFWLRTRGDDERYVIMNSNGGVALLLASTTYAGLVRPFMLFG